MCFSCGHDYFQYHDEKAERKNGEIYKRELLIKKERKIMKKYLLCVLFMLFCAAGCSKSPEEMISEQLSLGNKYLAEGNYEEAIVAFEKVIELDPKAMEAYTGIVNIYAKENNPAKARQWIELGYQQMEQDTEGNENFINVSIDTLLKETEETNLEMISNLLELSSETNRDTILEKIQEYTGYKILNEQSEFMNELQDLYQAENYDEIIHYIDENPEGFNLKDSSNDTIFYGEAETFIPDGFGIGIFNGNKGNSLMYIGEWKDGKRQGKGIDYFVDSIGQSGYYVGEWENDIPNGEAKKRIITSDGRVTEYVGQAVNGYAEGTYQKLFINSEGNISGYEFQCKAGVPQPQGHGSVQPGNQVSEDIMCLMINPDGSKEPVWHTWSGLQCTECREDSYADTLDFLNACDHSWAGWGAEKRVFSFLVD